MHAAWPSAKTRKLKGQRKDSSRGELHQVLYADDDSLIQQAKLNVDCLFLPVGTGCTAEDEISADSRQNNEGK